jgi:hypothetical protein
MHTLKKPFTLLLILSHLNAFVLGGVSNVHAANALFEKHPDTSIIATLDEQGQLVFPKGKAFTPDSSVRINIVNDFLILIIHGFRAIFVHLNIA